MFYFTKFFVKILLPILYMYCLNIVIQITLTYTFLHLCIWIHWQYFKYYCKSLTSVRDCSAFLTYCSIWKNSMHLRTYFRTERACVNVFLYMTCKKLAENACKTLKACKIFKSCYLKKSLTSCCFLYLKDNRRTVSLHILLFQMCSYSTHKKQDYLLKKHN
jgi:hypothetical protein